jgi:hypothetical protein
MKEIHFDAEPGKGILGHLQTYPPSPGFNGRTAASQAASKAAAAFVAVKARTQRERVLEALLAVYPAGMTSEEISDHSGLLVYRIRSRVAELQREGLVRDSEETRMGAAGLEITVWQHVGVANAG